VEQTVVDMDDSIKSSGLVVKRNLPHEPVQVVSDRKKLYRVIQNLLDNALKYSLEGTWIFVDLHKSDGQARVQGLYYPSLKALQMYAEGGSISI